MAEIVNGSAKIKKIVVLRTKYDGFRRLGIKNIEKTFLDIYTVLEKYIHLLSQTNKQ